MGVEVNINGAYGTDRWDVASTQADGPLLAVSAKSFMAARNQAAPNRLREMFGEAISVRESEPDAVLGYLCVIATDQPGRRGGLTSRHTVGTIARDIGVRCQRRDDDRPHHFDVGCVLAADLNRGTVASILAPGLLPYDFFIDALLQRWHRHRCGEANAARPGFAADLRVARRG